MILRNLIPLHIVVQFLQSTTYIYYFNESYMLNNLFFIIYSVLQLIFVANDIIPCNNYTY